MAPPTQRERLAAASAADDSADRVRGMSPEDRERLISEFDRVVAESAPTTEAARSDLLALLQAIGLEFIRRYYPTATMASFHVSRYVEKGLHEWSATIPVPVPGA